MNLATQLLQNVKEAKQAEDEMSIPKYDDLKTPNNHVGSTSNATKERKVTGLGDRVEKKPTADIGTPHNEKGRKMSEGEDPVQALNIRQRDGLLHFSHPNAPDQVYTIEWNEEIQNFLERTIQRHADVGQVFDLLHMWYEEGEGHDPQNMTGLNASKGNPNNLPPAPPTRNPHEPSPMREAANPIMQALRASTEGNAMRITSPDGSAAMLVPLTPAINKAINGYVTSPDARANTTAAAERLFKMLGQKVPGVKAVQPEQGAASQQQGGAYNQYQGDSANIDTSGMSMASMESKGHKAADGEMKKPAIKSGNPAKSAKSRTKQNDEPKNKGNPGSSKEEKGQTKAQFTAKPKDYKGGENEHKSMKKMHETKKSLEQLLGRKLNLG